MAEDDKDNNNEDEASEGEEGKKAGSGKFKLIALILIILLLIGLSVGGTLYLLGVFDSSDSGEEEVAEMMADEAAESDEPAVPAKAPAMYFPIKPAFVVNFSSRGRQRYLQAEVTVLTRRQDVFDALQKHLPLVKNQLVMLFGGEVYEDLQTDEGRELLRQKAMTVLQTTITEETGIEEGVEEVLFTNFVMQ